MSRRSVYWGKNCLYCGKNIAAGRAAFVSTYFVGAARGSGQTEPSLRTYSLIGQAHQLGADLHPDMYAEIRIRVAYHRRCIEGVLEHGPVDPEIEIADFEAYRAELIERIHESR